MPDVPWGACQRPFTPAFWKALAWRNDLECTEDFQLGDSLAEEVAACLLGGFGIPAEVGTAAFHRLKKSGLLSLPVPSTADFESTLTEPLEVSGRKIRYRFPAQKARYISESLSFIARSKSPPEGDRELRAWLLQCPGIGLKTASWITRNWKSSSEVAVIDVHIYRAGVLAGIFESNREPSQHYLELEDRFLTFCAAMSESAASLDSYIWRCMKLNARFARKALARGQK